MFDAAGVRVDDDEKNRRHAQGNQRKAPVQIEHHSNHAHQRDHIDQRAQQARRNKALNRVDIAGDTAHQVARLFVVVVGQREPLDMRIQPQPEIVHHPLTHTGGQIFFRVRTQRTHYGDGQSAKRGDLQNGEAVAASQRRNHASQPSTRMFGFQDVVDNQLQGPGLQQVRGAFADRRQQGDGQRLGVGLQQIRNT